MRATEKQQGQLGTLEATGQPEGAGGGSEGGGTGDGGALGAAVLRPLEPCCCDARLTLGKLTGDGAFQWVLRMHRSS